MGIQNASDNSVVTGSSASPVQDFLKNPPAKDTPPVVKPTPLPDSPPTPPPQTAPPSPDVPFTEDDRNRIGTKLTEAIAKAVQSGNLTSEEQLGEITEDILILVNKIQTQGDLTLVFDALSDKWPFLSSVILEERKQHAAVQHVEQMFKKPTIKNSANVS
ncbi:MAG: hypothetical protein UW22_C0042G0006 [Candidatus Gottesmanbacteria bacterium GW2011_GWB1_44_11c]|uniref:Uncharacterized protein n=1 Tax=Candidatus Gottesmanbacteria bacterium GW2011_GWB1_44_11c TaxID=1618447 RepID=A0A0G1JL78_9BACT|nr:MAG: hypothetical protein UW22_C0042G0006 [Candidatus Gottesmanbacteria bacterium GW2011_GWB1_44_11c]HCM82008.1 hypothetical protein [Patescibacteria group bacterium]